MASKTKTALPSIKKVQAEFMELQQAGSKLKTKHGDIAYKKSALAGSNKAWLIVLREHLAKVTLLAQHVGLDEDRRQKFLDGLNFTHSDTEYKLRLDGNTTFEGELVKGTMPWLEGTDKSTRNKVSIWARCVKLHSAECPGEPWESIAAKIEGPHPLRSDALDKNGKPKPKNGIQAAALRCSEYFKDPAELEAEDQAAARADEVSLDAAIAQVVSTDVAWEKPANDSGIKEFGLIPVAVKFNENGEDELILGFDFANVDQDAFTAFMEAHRPAYEGGK